MQVIPLQTKTGTAAASSPTVAATFTSNTTNNSTIIVAVTGTNGTGTTVASIADSQLNNYQLVQRINSNCDCEMWYAKKITGGACTVTATLSNSSTAGAGIIIREYPGLDLDSPLDQSATGTSPGSTTGATSATSLTTKSYELLVGIVATGASSTNTVGAGWGNFTTLNTAFGTIAMQDQLVKQLGQYLSSLTTSSASMGSVIGTFILIRPSLIIKNTRPRAFAPGIAR